MEGIKTTPIIYVCQAYSKYDAEYGDLIISEYDVHPAYQFAINTYFDLTRLGFEVFSPIMYTHPFHLAMKHPPIDYVAHDLKMIEGFMKDDGVMNRWDCMLCGSSKLFSEDGHQYYCSNCNQYISKASIRIVDHYDSGVCCVFAEDCLTRGCHIEPMTQAEWDQKWFVDEKKSKGAKAEYAFAHAHHIRCIRLSELLEKKKIEECEPF